MEREPKPPPNPDIHKTHRGLQRLRQVGPKQQCASILTSRRPDCSGLGLARIKSDFPTIQGKASLKESPSSPAPLHPASEDWA